VQCGHCANQHWPNGKGGGIDAINLNPTLFHEMVHCLQEHTGPPSRNGDHTREGAGRMQAIRLEPVAIDGTGGTGPRVTHTIVIVDGGRFAAAYETLATRDDWQGPDRTRGHDAEADTAAHPEHGQACVPLRCGERMGQARPRTRGRDRRPVGAPHGRCVP